MMLLISSRIIFTFSDVSPSGKEAVAVLLIVFLVLILLRTIGESLRRRITGKSPILVTPGMLKSLDPQEFFDVSHALASYQILHRRRVMEIDPDFAQSTKAASILLAKSQVALATTTQTPTGNTIASGRSARIRVVSTALSPTGGESDPAADPQDTQ
jgi:hypothetical protein